MQDLVNTQSIFSALVGAWFVCYSSFPMWLEGDKTNPEFNYTVSNRKGEKVLSDEVKYLKKGKEKTIEGYDYPDKKDSSAFIWHGKGILGLLKSKWRVALMDPKGEWAVIAFSRTLFTPEGVDIISRTPEITEDTFLKIKNLMEKDEELRGYSEKIVRLKK
ncbi:lipocalin family protein [Emticicia sp. BO119]|uniref:lipocalin family protein n=1 Tax=Emticicia sp. BO119 TaxID=2757768 RepID=UPI0015F0F888|nr:lipocalin family protein [Emticicia sp. BO119]MBA4851107.1 lipocalin family protein [Emticicia sp. BO119]